MIFEQIATGGCQSYFVGCPDACVAVLIDAELRQVDRYLATAARDGLRINEVLPDPTARTVTVCEFGKISALAAATLRDLGFLRAAALDGGMKAWRDGGFPVETSNDTQ